MRLFIAVPVDDKVRAAARELIAQLAQSGADVKWVAPENLHLTLSFLGEASDGRIASIIKAVEAAAAGQDAFDLEFDGVGAFGAPGRPRVLWIGIGRGAQELAELAASLKSALAAEGIPLAEEPGREFSAHLTIGRVRGARGLKALVERFYEAKVPEGLACRADKLVLFQSRLSPKGPAYAAVREVPIST